MKLMRDIYYLFMLIIWLAAIVMPNAVSWWLPRL